MRTLVLGLGLFLAGCSCTHERYEVVRKFHTEHYVMRDGIFVDSYYSSDVMCLYCGEMVGMSNATGVATWRRDPWK